MTIETIPAGAATRCLGRYGLALTGLLLLAACVSPPPPPPSAAPSPVPTVTAKVDESAMLPLLAYHQLLHRMTPQELSRERIVLAAIPQSPAAQVRQAMLYGQPRGPLDLPRALNLLEGVLKSADPVAVSLHPLARILADQYSERLKLEAQSDRLNQQLKDSQRKAVELQDKLDALADIERSLPVRPRAGKTLPGGAK